MSNAARIAVPGSGDNGKVAVYNSGTDAWDLVPTGSLSKTVSATTYTLIATDKGQTLKFTNAAAVACTVPSSVLAAGDVVGWEQWGTGAVTFAGGATLRSLGNLLSSAGQYSAGSIRFDTATEALVAGALA